MYNIDSDGQLFKMQQEAIKQARETASRATLPVPVKKASFTIKKKPSSNIIKKENKNFLSRFFKTLKTDDLILIGILILLIYEDADDDIILVIIFLLLSGFGLNLKFLNIFK